MSMMTVKKAVYGKEAFLGAGERCEADVARLRDVEVEDANLAGRYHASGSR